jgi:hypothetical protein
MYPVHASVHPVENLPAIRAQLALHAICELSAAFLQCAMVGALGAARVVPLLQVIK